MAPGTATPIHRKLIKITIAEIRRLLHLGYRPHTKDPTIHGVHWSNWRRAHQTEARRSHTARRLHRQILTI